MKILTVSGESPSGGAVLPANSVILWRGVAASVPSGWSLFATAQGQLIQGASAGGISLTSTGSLTHTHTNPSTDTTGAHTHATSGGSTSTSTASKMFYATANSYTSVASHSHNIGSGNTSSNGDHYHTNSDTVSASSLPPVIALYWITNSAEATLPVSAAIVYYNSLVMPTGFNLCDGVSAPFNMHQKFVLGASNDGEVGTTLGASTHSHENPDTDSAGAHTHTAYANLGTGGSTKNASTYAGTQVGAPHNHSGASASTSSGGAHVHTRPATGSAANLPPYIDLVAMECVAEVSEIPTGTIVAFKGSSSAIPLGWALCDGSGTTPNTVDKYIRTITSGTLEATGGASSHVHTNSATNSAGSHNHGGSTGGTAWNSGTVWVTIGSAATAADQNHSHSWSVTIGSNGSHTHNVGSTGSADNNPPHIKLYFIQKL